jgi:hypothetical protein
MTTSAPSSATRRPKSPRASSASRSAVTIAIVLQAWCGWLWLPRPREMQITSCAASTSIGERYVPMCPVPPITDMWHFAGRNSVPTTKPPGSSRLGSVGPRSGRVTQFGHNVQFADDRAHT